MNRFYELLKKLTLTGSQCVYCAREIPQGELACTACEKQVEALKNRDGFYDGGLLYAYRYDGPVRSLIHQFKYNGMPRYSVFIAQQMADFLNDYEVDADFLTFVPIHKNRLKQRGYDQGEMIATHLGVLLGLPCRSVLERTRDTKPQFKLDARQRKKNIEGAFALKKGADVKGKNILLIDDIYTTGMTVSEAMRPLKDAGASVMVFTYSKEFPI
ncbi:ComF family protein [Christensenella timonensis]|uniref:ComF family protein n=1 Tax=Christensenella timonensis TaxID=1816678 RepID=UPI0008365757|nr:ComF family protein [Christensenella timonensis]